MVRHESDSDPTNVDTATHIFSRSTASHLIMQWRDRTTYGSCIGLVWLKLEMMRSELHSKRPVRLRAQDDRYNLEWTDRRGLGCN